jgi:hypothetical protein
MGIQPHPTGTKKELSAFCGVWQAPHLIAFSEPPGIPPGLKMLLFLGRIFRAVGCSTRLENASVFGSHFPSHRVFHPP